MKKIAANITRGTQNFFMEGNFLRRSSLNRLTNRGDSTSVHAFNFLPSSLIPTPPPQFFGTREYTFKDIDTIIFSLTYDNFSFLFYSYRKQQSSVSTTYENSIASLSKTFENNIASFFFTSESKRLPFAQPINTIQPPFLYL